MSIIALAGVFGLTVDVATYGVSTQCGYLLTLVDAINHCIAYRANTQVLRNQKWHSIMATTIVLKIIAGWCTCAVRGMLPDLARYSFSLSVLLFAVTIIHKSPHDIVYRTLRTPECAAVLSLCGAIYHWKKMLTVVEYSLPASEGYIVVLLFVEGTGVVRTVDNWWAHRRKFHIGTLYGAASYAFQRIIPTWILFTIVTVADTGDFTTNAGVWLALIFYLANSNVRIHLRLWWLSNYPSGSEKSTFLHRKAYVVYKKSGVRCRKPVGGKVHEDATTDEGSEESEGDSGDSGED